MAYNENPHVKRMYQFLPFRPGISESVTELQNESQKLDIKTRSIEYLTAIMHKRPGMVILTGNAGHGKTYICERVLMDYAGLDSANAKAALRRSDIMSTGVTVNDKSKSHYVRIHKDLSQESIADAARYLVTAIEGASGPNTTLICANEGRLRAVVEYMRSSNPDEAQLLLHALQESIESGIASRSLKITTINLNYQSVAAISHQRPHGSMIAEALHEWVDDGRSWASCKICDAADCCPILRNRALLVEQDEKVSGATGETRQEGLVQLFRTAELFGHVTTIREMLMVLAYVITGDLNCGKVHAKAKRGRSGWGAKFAFFQNAFAVDLKQEHYSSVPLLRLFNRLDPGVVARRKVDDAFSIGQVVPTKQKDLLIWSSKFKAMVDAREIASGQAVMTTGTETGKEEAEDLKRAMEVLRRRDYFDLWSHRDRAKTFESRAQRQGLESLAEMEWFISKDSATDRQKRSKIKNEIIRGLNALQGLFPDPKTVKLSIVHQAFSKHARRVALVARSIEPGDVELATTPPEWCNDNDSGHIVSTQDVTDWYPREIWVIVKGKSIPLNLRRFDYVRRAGRGFVSREFYSGDIRRIVNFLSRTDADADENNASFLIQSGTDRYELSVSENLFQ